MSSEATSPDELRECIVGLVWQFGHRGVKDGKPIIHSGGLSDMECAFQILGWDDPHFLTEEEQDGSVCEIVGCVSPACAGMRWGDLYLRLCSEHSRMGRVGSERPPVKQMALDREAKRGPDGVLRLDDAPEAGIVNEVADRGGNPKGKSNGDRFSQAHI